MERLTRRICGGWGVTPGYELNTVRGMKAVVDRLADYEDTGLEPEDISAIQRREQIFLELLVNISCGCAVTYTRLAELAQAEKDGRLVILPPNDPLTLDELREMDGKPVWVEIPNNMVSEWCIAKFDPLMNRVRLWCSGGGWFDGRNVGKSLFVYRRKPKELEGRIEVC